ncbi:hypothetical protein Ahy_B06g082443 [Arachis hypogaea]|uniref:Uncharacterized protein n=1 Tax=Arachis hypogaea TaxID=3818 RepID=A0A444YNK5_ARAHY|nr:hypothetical protein Ahy_B06g082443 [Arachis hypogaea]
MKPPNGRKIVLKFNETLQLVGVEAGILSSILELLGSDYTKFSICEKDSKKVRSKDKIYNECMLYHDHYNSQLTIEQNIEGRPLGIIANHWRWYLDYRNSEDTKEKCCELIEAAIHSHWQIEKLGKAWRRRVGMTREEKRIAEIEQDDESSILLSQNDSLAQVLRKEHLGRVRGMGIRPTSSQVFGTNSHQSSNRAQREETQRVLLELQAELTADKLKRKTIEDEVATKKTKRMRWEPKKTKRQAVEDEVVAGKIKMKVIKSALRCPIQEQGRELPPDVAAWMNSLEGQSESRY